MLEIDASRSSVLCNCNFADEGRPNEDEGGREGGGRAHDVSLATLTFIIIQQTHVADFLSLLFHLWLLTWI